MALFSLSFAVALFCWVVASASVAALWPRMQPRIVKRHSAEAADLIFFLQVLPAFIVAAVLLLFLIPGFEIWEPADAQDKVDFWLSGVALFSVLCVARAISLTWRRLLGPMNKLDLPVFVSGIWRPQVRISPAARALLTARERRLIIRHEHAHVRRSDNLRILCADFVRRLSVGREVFAKMESERRRLSELAADNVAAADRNSAAELAHALLKIARMITPAVSAMPHAVASSAMASGFVSPAHEGNSALEQRVLRLLSENAGDVARDRAYKLVAGLGLLLSALLLLAFQSQIQFACYRFFESVIAF